MKSSWKSGIETNWSNSEDMASTLEAVSKNILEPSELQIEQLGGFLDGLQSRYVDAGDLVLSDQPAGILGYG